MNKPLVLEGRVFVIVDKDGKPIDDIDTDMIFHNKHLHITDINEMGKYAFGNLTGWEDFSQKVQPNDILIVGKNFGAGSSRQQAVDCFRALGIQLIIGESYGAIYKRNAINSGMPLMTAPGIMATSVKSGDKIRVNLETGEIYSAESKKLIMKAQPLSKVQLDIYQAGNLFEYGKTITG